MASKELMIETVISAGSRILNSKEFKSFVCGTYSDGTPRSLPDALNDELYSPKQKAHCKKKKKKKKAKFKL